MLEKIFTKKKEEKLSNGKTLLYSIEMAELK